MEDVRFLRENAHEDSYLMVVDSARRDTVAYPSPNEYSVEFRNPFKNVIGLDLLDVQLPRSEYTVEEGKNSLEYIVDDGEKRSVTIDPGDYNLVQLCEELTLQMEDVAAEPHSNPYTKTSRIRLFSKYPFELRASKSTLAKSIGFNNTTKTFYSVSAPGSGTRIYTGPFPESRTQLLNESKVVRQSFVATSAGPVARIVVYADQGGSPFTARIVNAEGATMAISTIEAGDTEAAGVNSEIDLVRGETYYLVLEYAPSSNPSQRVGTTIFVGTPGDNLAAELATSTDGPWTSLPTVAVSGEVWVDAMRYEITSPGLVDLTGEKYVLIRCPEIESFMHRDRAHEKHHPGLGMVRLGTNGFQEQRFDFVSFPVRKLTNPIGKLSQLTFRLEKADGTLYNTRGLDHLLTLVVRYYSIVQGVAPEGNNYDKLRNPAYTPNVTHHMQDRWRAQIQMKDKFNAWSSQHKS